MLARSSSTRVFCAPFLASALGLGSEQRSLERQRTGLVTVCVSIKFRLLGQPFCPMKVYPIQKNVHKLTSGLFYKASIDEWDLEKSDLFGYPYKCQTQDRLSCVNPASWLPLATGHEFTLLSFCLSSHAWYIVI